MLVTLNLTSGTGSLAGTAQVMASAGLATFSGLSVDRTGTNKILTATAPLTGGAVQKASNTYTITAAAASALAFATQPSAVNVSQQAFAQNPVVWVLDAFGNIVTSGADGTAPITLALHTGSGLLSGTVTATATGGVADFSGAGLSIDLAGVDKVLRASKTDTSGGGGTPSTFVDSGIFSVVHAGAVALSFATPPGGGPAGNAWAQQPVVHLLDAAGNLVNTGVDANASIALSKASGTGTLSGAASLAAVGGVATFAGLSIDIVGNKTLMASKPSTAGTTTSGGTRGSPALQLQSTSFTITPDQAVQLVYATQPGGGTAGQVWGQQPVVQVQDAYGNLVTSGPDSAVTIAVSLTSGSGPLLGSATAVAAGGIAAFTTLQINLAGTADALTASTTLSTAATPSVTSQAFAIEPAYAQQLVFSTEPGGGGAGVVWGQQPVLLIEDAFGNTVDLGSDSNLTVTLTLSSGSGSLGGSTAAVGQGGMVEFSANGLSIDQQGPKRLTAAAVASHGTISGMSAVFTITPNTQRRLVFTTQPGGGTAGVAWAQQPVVQIQDSVGNLVTTGMDSTTTVTLSLLSGSGALAGTVSEAAIGGVATFTDASLDLAGTNKVLQAQAALSGGPASASSASFIIVHAAAYGLSFATEPSAQALSNVPLGRQPRILVQDAYGNTVSDGPDATATIALTLTHGTGVLAGTTTMTAAAGVADFAGLGIAVNLVGNKQMTATKADTSGSSGGTTALTQTSSFFDIAHGAATQLAFSTQPSGGSAGAAWGSQPVVFVLDAAGNVVTDGVDATAQITLALTGGSGALSGTATVAAANGVATFAGLSANIVGSKQLTATKAATNATVSSGARGSPATSVVSASFNITPAAASQLVFVSEAGGGIAGVVWGQQPVVQVQDPYGNLVTATSDSSVAVSLALSGGVGPLLGTATVNASGGVATFTNLNLQKISAADVLTASATIIAGSVTKVGQTFAVAAAQASQVAFTTQPGGGSAGGVWAQQPAVQVEDIYGNRLSTGADSSVSVTLTLSTGTGVLAGSVAKQTVAGVADFVDNGLSIDAVGANKVLAVTANITAGTVSATSGTFAITQGSATRLVFTTQPSGGAAHVAWGTQPVVQVQDSNGNLVTTGPDSTVNVVLTLTGGTGPLGGTTTIAAAGGVATFTNLGIDLVGTKHLTATATFSGGTTSAVSNSFAITHGAAHAVVFARQPSATSVSQVPFAQQPKLVIQDTWGNTVTTGADAAAQVFMALTSGTGVLAGTSSIYAVGGVADFSGRALSIDLQGANKVLTATKADTSGGGGTTAITAASNLFSIITGTTASIAFAQQPGGGTAGAVWGTQPTVHILDAAGNLITTGVDANASITLSLQSGTGALSGTSTVAAVNGVATFAGLSINLLGNKVLRAMKADTAVATQGGVVRGSVFMNTTSNSFAIAAAAASQLIFITQPGSATAGQALMQQPVVQVRDALGNLVTVGADASVLVTLTLSHGPGALQGTVAVMASGGIATFSNLRLDTAAAGDVLTAGAPLAGGATSQASVPFNVLAASASQVVFTTQPGGGTAGELWAQDPVVQMQDAFGNLVSTGADSSKVVTLTLTSGTGTLSGVSTLQATGGIADFGDSSLFIDLIGVDKRLSATATLTGGGVTVASNAFTIAAAAATKLVFTTQPGGGNAGAVWAQQPVVQIQDGFGNRVTAGADATASVALGISTGTGALGGTPTRVAGAGIATFTDLQMHLSGSKKITATATLGGVSTTVISNPLTIIPGPAVSVAFATQPSASSASSLPFVQQPKISILDVYGNLVTTSPDAAALVTLTLTSGTGVLAGTTSMAAVGGVADFAGRALAIDATGSKVLTATKIDTTAGGGTGALSTTSNPFSISSGTATHLVFSTQPSGAVAGSAFTGQPVVQVRDAAGNLVTTGPDATTAVTLTLTSGSGTLLGSQSVAASGGIAAFAGLEIDTIGSKVLSASKSNTSTTLVGGVRGSLAMVLASNAFTVTASNATQLVFTTQPGGGVAGAVWAQQPVVQIQDTYGNPVTSGADATRTITLSLTSGAGPLAGPATVTASGGVATFSGLKINPTGNADSLTASGALSGGLATQISNTFAITPDQATHLVFVTQPGGGTAGAAWSQQPVVQVQDQYGNLVTAGPDSIVVVSLGLSTGTGVLAGGASKQAQGGVATFADNALAVNLAGSGKILSAAATVTAGPVSTTSSPFAITAAQATQIVFMTQPGGGAAHAVWGAQPVVQVLDNYGNLVTTGADSTVPVILTLASGSGALSGTTNLAAAAGVATFVNLQMDVAGIKRLMASAALSGGGATRLSTSFTIVPAAATTLAFTTQPSASTVSQVPFARMPVVAINDSYGNPITQGPDATATVTLTHTTGAGSLGGAISVAATGGVANFAGAGLNIDAVGVNHVLTATKANTTGSGGTAALSATTGAFAIVNGAASQVVFTTQPVGAAASAAFASQPVVEIRDAAGNRVTQGVDATATVTLRLGAGTGSLSGTTSIAASAGVATFAGLSIDLVGSKTLVATKADTAATTGTGGIRGAPAVGATSGTFTIGLGPATQLAFSTQPGGGVAGAQWGQQPVVRILDALGNLVTTGADSSKTVTLSLSAGTGPLGGTASVNAIGGIATFTDLRLNAVGGADTLTASCVLTGGLATRISQSFAITPAAASQLVMTTQPSGGTAGAPWSQQPVVQVQDAYGNIVTSGVDSSRVIALTLSTGTGTLMGASSKQAIAGIAAFGANALAINLTGVDKVLTASTTITAGARSVASSPFTISAADAAQLVFATQPGGGVAHAAWPQQPVVQIQDTYGNLVTSGADSTDNVTLVLVGGTGTLNGTVTRAASGGVATFAGLAMDVTGIKRLRAQANLVPGLVSQNSSTFTITSAAASVLVLQKAPSASTVSQTPFAQQPQVAIEDAYGNLVTAGPDATATVTLTLSAGTGVLGGTVATSAVGGVANFAGLGLNIDLVGVDKKLTAAKADTTGSGGTAAATMQTGAFAITYGVATQVAFGTQPGGAATGAPLTPQPVANILDAAGNLVTGGVDATATVQLTLSSGTGVLQGNTQTAASNGVATFAGLDITAVGNKRLTATKLDTASTSAAGVLRGSPQVQVVSHAFTIAFNTATHLAFATQPGGGTAGQVWGTQPVVQVLDAAGNLVTSGADSTVAVTLTLTTGTGPLAGTVTVNATGGIATFTNLKINKIGSADVLTAAAPLSGGGVTQTSAPFVVTADVAAHLAYTVQPGGGVAGVVWSQQPVVQVQDQYGNLVSTGADSTRNVTLSLTAGTGVVTGGLSKQASGGVADFTNNGLSHNLAGVDKVLTAAATITSGPVTVVSNAYTITPAAASQLVFTTQPAGGAAHAVWGQQPVVQVQDAYGNRVSTGADSARSIVLALSAGTGSLGGTTALTATAGQAAFTNLYIDVTGNKKLTATAAALSPGSTSVVSNAFAIGASAAATVAFTTQPSASTVAQVSFARQPRIVIEDNYGNLVTAGPDATATVTLTLTSGAGVLGGTVSMAAVGGVADFAGRGLNINLVGVDKVLSATKADTTVGGGSASLTSTSGAFTITHGKAASIAFSTPPGGVAAGSLLSPQPHVTALDAAGNVVTDGPDATALVTLALSSGTGSLTGTASVLASAGVATFAGLSIDKVGSKQLQATKVDTATSTASGVVRGTPAMSVTCAAFTIGLDTANQLVFTTQPGGGTAGQLWGTQPVVQIQDAEGNLVTAGADATRLVTLSLTSGTGTLSGTLSVLAAGGVATFTNLQLDKIGQADVLTAAANLTGGATTQTSTPFVVTAAAASQVAFVTQPGGGVAGSAWAQQPVMQVQDALGNLVSGGADSSVTVSLALSSGTGSLSGASTKQAIGGVVSFADSALGINLTGVDKRLTASATLTAGAVNAVSNAFTITPSAATQLVFSSQPGGGVAHVAWGQQPVVQVQDTYGNIVTGGADSTVDIALTLTSGLGSLPGGTTTVTASAGQSTFVGLYIDAAGSKKLTATAAALSPGSTSRVSNSFTIVANTATTVAFATQPSASTVALVPLARQPQVTIADSYGNLIAAGPDATATVTLSLTGGVGTLGAPYPWQP